MYEMLKEMGVTDIDHIEKYTLRQEGDEDVLKIYFRRKKGDFFPRSIKFRHGRSVKTVPINSGRGEYKEVSEISPHIQKAVAELEQIVQHEENIADFKKRILNDIDHLEKVIERKLSQLRSDVERLE